MPHLPSERLAALIDEPPTPDELAHLTTCAECAREPAAYALLAGLTEASEGLTMPLTRWESLRPALEREGLLTARVARGAAFSGRRPWVRAAAVLLLVSGGMLAGRYSAGAPLIPIGRGTPATLDTGIADAEPQFRSVAEAQAAEHKSQNLYQSAVAFLAQHDSSGRTVDSPASMTTRLAALDQVRAAMAEALRDAPFDPVINGYYLSTLGQQAATRRQLASPLRLTSY